MQTDDLRGFFGPSNYDIPMTLALQHAWLDENTMPFPIINAEGKTEWVHDNVNGDEEVDLVMRRVDQLEDLTRLTNPVTLCCDPESDDPLGDWHGRNM